MIEIEAHLSNGEIESITDNSEGESAAKLISLCYKIFAKPRKDVSVEKITATVVVCKELEVTLDDDGSLLVDGELADVEKITRIVDGLPPVIIKLDNLLTASRQVVQHAPQPQAITAPQAQPSEQPVQRPPASLPPPVQPVQKLSPIEELGGGRQVIEFDKATQATKANEIWFIPTDQERERGVFSVVYFARNNNGIVSRMPQEFLYDPPYSTSDNFRFLFGKRARVISEGFNIMQTKSSKAYPDGQIRMHRCIERSNPSRICAVPEEHLNAVPQSNNAKLDKTVILAEKRERNMGQMKTAIVDGIEVMVPADDSDNVSTDILDDDD